MKPESTQSFEAGIELNLFNNRLAFEATYYMSETKDQIIPLTVSGSTGYLFRVVNAGLITNKGVEFSLQGSPVQTKDFTWHSALTLASNKNKVKELIGDVEYYRLTSAPFKVEIGATKGAEYGVIMGTDYKYDKNGNKIITEKGLYAATDDNKNLGSIYPDFTGGWSNTFKYKNLDFSILFDFSKGGHYFSTSHMWGMYSGMLEESAANNIREKGIILDGVQADGSKNTVVADGKEYCKDFYVGPAVQSVFKSDYIKLREIDPSATKSKELPQLSRGPSNRALPE